MGWFWRDLVIGWVVFFLLPKAIVVPIFRGMWRSMRETERLDRLDRARLEDVDGGTPVPVRHGRPRRPGGAGPFRRRLEIGRARRSRSPRVRR